VMGEAPGGTSLDSAQLGIRTQRDSGGVANEMKLGPRPAKRIKIHLNCELTKDSYYILEKIQIPYILPVESDL